MLAFTYIHIIYMYASLCDLNKIFSPIPDLYILLKINISNFIRPRFASRKQKIEEEAEDGILCGRFVA